MSKEKLIFLFCSGLLLFVISIPNGDGKAAPAAAGAPGTVQGGGGTDSSQTPTADSAEPAAGTSTIQEAPLPSFGGAKTAQTYESELEERIRQILAGVDGVGEVDVMVVLKSSREKVLHVDKNTSVSSTEERNGDGTSRIVKQQELSESTVTENQSQTPVVEKELSPEVAGIIISADGGGSAAVKAEISEAMEALFGLPAHKIKVLKRVKKGV